MINSAQFSRLTNSIFVVLILDITIRSSLIFIYHPADSFKYNFIYTLAGKMYFPLGKTRLTRPFYIQCDALSNTRFRIIEERELQVFLII
jgi:hypothetical protein